MLLKNKISIYLKTFWQLSVIALFAVSGLLLFLINSHDGGWYSFDSAAEVPSLWYLFGMHTKEVWLYWFGGGAYVLTIGIACLLVKRFIWPQDIKKDWENWLGLSLVSIAIAGLCQTYQVGNYGTLPGGGVFGSWLIGTALINLDLQILHILLLSSVLVGLVLFTNLFFAKWLHFITDAVAWALRPVVNKITNKEIANVPWVGRVWRWANGDSIKEVVYKSVVEHEYNEVVEDDERIIYKDDFWNVYADGKEPIAVQDFKQSTYNDDSGDLLEAEEDLVAPEKHKDVELPGLEYDMALKAKKQSDLQSSLEMQAEILVAKLNRFGITGEVTAIKPGPVITLFEFAPAADAKISKIIALDNDLALALETRSLRIIAPVPGRSVVGFEVANKVRENVYLSDVLQADMFTDFTAAVKKGRDDSLSCQLPIAIGKNIVGDDLIIDLTKTPHLLIAGSTGSGKSVALNSILVSLLCSNPPERLRLILVDPKRLEFAQYSDIGHLLFPIVTEPKKSLLVLRWVIAEMEKRYETMAQAGVRNVLDYNAYLSAQGQKQEQLPLIVIVIDELADLMMTTGKDVEDLITRVAQMARAAGIHMIVATQRPSVDVITGLIKVNFPSRISFRVASKADSRTILDCGGADSLLGSGDMLFLDSQSSELRRAHGAYVSDDEINKVVGFINKNYPTNYVSLENLKNTAAVELADEDDLIDDVLGFLKEIDEVSISLLQRKFRIGYNRSARIMDVLESEGYVLTLENGKMRKVLKDRLE